MGSSGFVTAICAGHRHWCVLFGCNQLGRTLAERLPMSTAHLHEQHTLFHSKRTAPCAVHCNAEVVRLGYHYCCWLAGPICMLFWLQQSNLLMLLNTHKSL
jgi:hypothetical protein